MKSKNTNLFFFKLTIRVIDNSFNFFGIVNLLNIFAIKKL